MKRKAFKTALPYTVPIFAGSAEFVAVNLLLGAFIRFRHFLPFILFPLTNRLQSISSILEMYYRQQSLDC